MSILDDLHDITDGTESPCLNYLHKVILVLKCVLCCNLCVDDDLVEQLSAERFDSICKNSKNHGKFYGGTDVWSETVNIDGRPLNPVD
jgi:hypothetical protein